MKFLGIDYGIRKTGLAISNEEGTIAFPLEVVKNSRKLPSVITDLCREKGVSVIVLGESVDTADRSNPVMENIDQFKKKLEQDTRLPVHLQPEQFTSREAEQVQGKTARNDASAAALILQDFLDSQNIDT